MYILPTDSVEMKSWFKTIWNHVDASGFPRKKMLTVSIQKKLGVKNVSANVRTGVIASRVTPTGVNSPF